MKVAWERIMRHLEMMLDDDPILEAMNTRLQVDIMNRV